MKKWRNLGLVYRTESYAQTPTPLVLGDRVRVYFAERDQSGKSFIRFVDLGRGDVTQVIGGSSGPVLTNGAVGAFDSCGQMPSYAVGYRPDPKHPALGPTVALWYSGWLAPAGEAPYHNATGLVLSLDGGDTFKRTNSGPILDRTPAEPYLAVTPCFLGGSCWYITGLRWEWLDGRLEPIYGITQAELGGLGWKRYGVLAIPQAHPLECFSRPWVTRIGDDWHMHYSFRSALNYRDGANAYRLGYARSRDGVKWVRADDELEFERQDWCSTMLCYGAVFELDGKHYMVVNGDTFGKYGFGIAVAE